MRRGPLLILFLTVLVDLIGFGIVMPLLPFYATQFHATPFEVGLLVASFSFFQLIFAPLWGHLSDSLGRRPILMFGLAVTSMAYCLLGFAKTLTAVFVARSLAGIGAANISTAQAYVADVTGPSERARGMGMIGAAFGLGFVLGPGVGGALYTVGATMGPGWGLAMPAVAASLLSTAALAMAFFMLPEPERREEEADRLAHLQRTPALLKVAVAAFFLSTFCFASVEAVMPLWLLERFHCGPRENGYLFGFMGLVVVLVQGGLIRHLVKRLGEARMALFGCVVLATGLFFLPWVSQWTALFGVVGILALGQGTIHPGLMSLISRLGGAKRKGGRIGMAQGGSALGRILGPVAAGQLYMWPGPQSPYLAGGATMLLAALLALLLVRGCPPAVGEQA